MRGKLLGETVADADRLKQLARQAHTGLSAEGTKGHDIVDAAEFLG